MKRNQHKQLPRKPSNSLSSEERASQTFAQHIQELRRRLIWSVILCGIVGTLVYNYHDFFMRLVMSPLGHEKLIYLTPVGGFSFVFMVTLYVTILIVAPFLLYQVYAFIRPAIPKHTRSLSVKVAVAAVLLMATGATFGYVYAVPGGLRFLTEFASNYVTPSLTADSYLNFVLGYVAGLGLLFELPLLLLFWHWINPTTPKGLLKSERWVILLSFIVAALVSPSPDVLSQTIIAVPLIVIYQVGVVCVLLSIRKSRRSVDTQAVLSNQPFTQAVLNSQLVEAGDVTPLSAHQPKAKATSPERQHVSFDGMTVTKLQTTKPLVCQLQYRPARREASVQVPSRQVISDFVPVRRTPGISKG